MDSDFLIKNINSYTIIYVRSPSEYLKGHIPTSINIPLFSDENRKIIGILYKQKGKKAAIEKGLSFVDLLCLSKQFENISTKPIIIYCARGGMRSSSVSWLLNLLEYDVVILKGGYKFFRRWVISQFKKEYNLKIISGYTGIGKTEIIQLLDNSIDLEALANHKGSVFGGFDQQQPMQEHFENLLAAQLSSQDGNIIYIEDESRFIGKVCIPNDFYIQMKIASIIILQDTVENRMKKSVSQYKHYSNEDLKSAVKKLEKKLGRVSVQTISSFIDNSEYEAACSLLFSYYDKCYDFALSKKNLNSISHLKITKKNNEQISFLLQEIT